jgi:hypothetical protein
MDRWINEGMPLQRFLWRLAGVVVLAVTLYGFFTHVGHPGAAWWLVWLLLAVSVWLAQELLRWRLRYHVLEQRPITPVPRSSLPDFSAEWQREQFIRDHYTGSNEDAGAVDQWIKDVHQKLVSWNPKAARQFSAVSVPLTKAARLRSRAFYGPTVDLMTRLTEVDPILKRLKDHADRLAEIVSPTTSSGLSERS